MKGRAKRKSEDAIHGCILALGGLPEGESPYHPSSGNGNGELTNGRRSGRPMPLNHSTDEVSGGAAAGSPNLHRASRGYTTE
jgi:hypothetical protein